MAWEWTRLCLGRFERGGLVLAGMALLIGPFAYGAPRWTVVILALAAVLAPLLRQRYDRSRLWLAGGALYIGIPSLCLVWLRDLGPETLFWLLFLVWATDSGAYVAGRLIGGPRLAPSISPKKTWAGLAGGMVSAGMIGLIMAWANDIAPWMLALLSMLLAVIAQIGDLAESAAKRHFGVKDSSGIIPGHGGILDRLDGLLAAAPVAALLCLAFGGGLPLWR